MKSKTEGGLGLRDPYILNHAMGAKFFWHWLNGGNDLCKTIWTKKYNMPAKPEEILRIRDTPKGSTIWNLTNVNKEIIARHAFWEIRDGSSVRIWEEAWQQRKILSGLQALTDIGQKSANKGMNLVKDFWETESQDEVWRIWKNPGEWMDQIAKEQKELYQKEMQTSRIPIRFGPDILRWDTQ